MQTATDLSPTLSQGEGGVMKPRETGTVNPVQTLEQERAAIAQQLLDLKQHWPYSEKLHWCIRNGYNVDAVNRGYLRGTVNSIIVARALRDEMVAYSSKS